MPVHSRTARGGSYARQPHDRDHLLQAGWMAQELLSTFAEELGSVTLTPDRTGGVFEVRIDDELIWSRKERGRFPEIKEIKQLIRDRVAPGRSLGHTDTPLTT
ncbi:MAG: SelT/SelW/SelH family protein [Xanthobacteraceae bacterium]